MNNQDERIYANIIIDISHEQLDRVFQYLVPEHLVMDVKVGLLVNIPFGKGNKLITGYVIELVDKSDYPIHKIKSVDSIRNTGVSLDTERIRLAMFIKKRYGGTMIHALKTVLPVKTTIQKKVEKKISLVLDAYTAQILEQQFSDKKQYAKARLMKRLLIDGTLDWSVAISELGVSAKTIDKMVEHNILTVDESVRQRTPYEADAQRKVFTELTDEQEQAIKCFETNFAASVCKTYLLFGITGSGKTRVYIEMIRLALLQGKQVIMLIPEIALTYQTVHRFQEVFGDCVSVMNSKLSQGERFDQFERARLGDVRIMIGPRSALFTPFDDLGLIIIDEEHETSYKSDTKPKYHAREVAKELAIHFGASLVLGSATPSLETYKLAMQGEYELLELKNRYEDSELPKVSIVDLRDELKNGNRSIFSKQLQYEMQRALDHKEQIMLFMNRRGYAGFISCRACGTVVKCQHCDISLTQHSDGKLKCHYCGYEREALNICPECGSPYILGFKAGTQQIEALLHKQFPTAKTLRMDADTTRKKDGYDLILSKFSEQKADILIGTQMIAKGHDFPNVTLVGIIAADLSLFANDYQSGEKTFQLLTQVGGRAGRANKPGKVVIQTYQPDHYCIKRAANHDYTGFYKEEMAYRTCMGYPPVSNVLMGVLQGREQDKVVSRANEIVEYVKKNYPELVVVGPTSATIEKIKDVYRQVFYLKESDEVKALLIRDQLEYQWEQIGNKEDGEAFFVDVNPLNTY